MRRTQRDLSGLTDWLTTYGVSLHAVEVQKTTFGSGIVAVRAIPDGDEPMIHVPANLVLSSNYVWKQAEKDPQLKEVLEALGEFAKSPRGAILTFLLMQILATSPDMSMRVGLDNPWTTYVQYLPTETALPTFWTEHEQRYADGTSLAPALAAKIKSIHREFEVLRSSLEDIDWCRQWFDPDTGYLSVHDWIVVDAIWRSRAMELPSHGLCMVPIADMANHAHGPGVNSRTDVEHDTGDVRLVLNAFQAVDADQEVTITYGEEKGACEMIFSYGFLDKDMTRAESIFLDMAAPDDDPLFLAKKHVFDCAPGFRLMGQVSSPDVTWTGPFIWLMCVNEEDGLAIEVVQQDDGTKKLKSSWKGRELKSVVDLEDALSGDENWDLFRLRAFSLVNQRVSEELDARNNKSRARTEEDWWKSRDESTVAWQLSDRLRNLEEAMLQQARTDFDFNMEWLAQSKAVQKWFNGNESPYEGEVSTTYTSYSVNEGSNSRKDSDQGSLEALKEAQRHA